MASTLDDVLRRVAAGELSPEDAVRELGPQQPAAAAGSSTPADAPPAPVYGTPPPAGAHVPDDGVQDPPPAGASGGTTATQGTANGPVLGVRLRVAYRSVEVVGDPDVAEAVVSSPYVMRREGGFWVVEASDGPPIFGERGEDGGQRFSFSALPRTVAWARSWKDHALVLRMNPALPVELDVIGCSVRLSDIEAGARIRLVASSLKADRLRGPLDLDAASSAVKGSIGPSGRSRIVAEQSSVKAALLAGTGLRIRAENRMSKIALPSSTAVSAGFDVETLETTVGHGEGQLLIEALMSTVALDEDRL